MAAQYDLIMDQTRWGSKEIWRVDLWMNGEPVFAGSPNADNDHAPGKKFPNREQAMAFIQRDAATRGFNDFSVID